VVRPHFPHDRALVIQKARGSCTQGFPQVTIVIHTPYRVIHNHALTVLNLSEEVTSRQDRDDSLSERRDDVLQQRPYSASELLAWCRLLALGLAGSAMAYVREREGSIDGLIDFWSERLAGLSMEIPGGGVEQVLLGLLLNVEAIGAEITSRSVNPEGGEVEVGSLPGVRVRQGIEDQFEVSLSDEEILAAFGMTREEMNRLLDVFGRAAAKSSFEYLRQEEDGTQQLKLRAW
jgi:hypothetical protein